MKKYIELNYCNWIDEDYEDRVRFIRPHDIEFGEKLASFTDFRWAYDNCKKITIYNFIDFMEQCNIDNEIIKELWIDYQELWEEEEDWSIYKIKLDMIDTFQDGDMEYLLQQVTNYFEVDDFIKPYLEFLGYQFGTIGYPEWGYYVATNELEHEYIRDLWNGANFYDLDLLDEQGEVIEGVCQCYLVNNEDLEECVENNFGIKKDEINLIKNECSEYFDFKQYEMRPASYNFIEVK